MNPACPVMPRAIGVMARMVARAVITTGRTRLSAPTSIASSKVMPRSRRYWLIRSISTIAFVTTMPTSMSSPIIVDSPSGVPVASSARNTPVAAKGIDTSSTSGWRSELNVATITTYTVATAASSASPRSRNVCACCSAAPPTAAVTPSGRSSSATACVTRRETAPRSSSSGVTVTTAVRSPFEDVTRAGTGTRETSARSPSGTGPSAVSTGTWRRASRDSTGSGSPSCTAKLSNPKRTSPTGTACRAAAAWPATASSVRPSRAAATVSTSTWNVGRRSEAGVVTSRAPSTGRSAWAT